MEHIKVKTVLKEPKDIEKLILNFILKIIFIYNTFEINIIFNF